MLNRTIAPPLREITNLYLPKPEIIHLDNGIPVYINNMGTQPIVKMELVFQTGRWKEEQKLISRATSRLLKEGTAQKSGADIAEFVDFYGASIGFPASLDNSNVVLFSLTKHFDKLLPLVDDILTRPAFAEDDIEKFKRRSLQRMKVDTSKTDVIAYRKITEAIFGKHHPYGYNSQSKLFENINQSAIVKHFDNHYRAGNVTIFLSGSPTDNVLENLNNTLGRNLPKGKTPPKSAVIRPFEHKKIHIPKQHNLQTAIRIGRRTFNRNHADYKGFYILNTILGGYFGARLMMNLREDKGYTYGVYSSTEPMLYDGYFTISTEVAKGAANDAIREIYGEFKRLREELVSDDEMQMVRNYILGYLLNGLDGPFNVTEIIKTFVTEGVDTKYYDDLVHEVKTITPERLRNLANKYLREEDMYEVVVG